MYKLFFFECLGKSIRFGRILDLILGKEFNFLFESCEILY